MDQEKEWNMELEHFHSCRLFIEKNVKKYEMQASDIQKETEELYREVNSGNTELYNQLIVSSGLAEHTKRQLAKNISALKQPYFGRIDYRNLSQEKKEKIYIGKNGVFKNKTDVLIADWRSPIATVYYENELGTGSYQIPSGQQMEIDLKLKRTFSVQNGELQGYYDSDVAANDELLVQYLSKNKDVVLGDIIATIQKEQNAIIRANPFGSTIVQGVAGSGKTTVAMHRISYILYNYAEKFTSNEFCIIGSNDVLIRYITGGLGELDVYDMKQKRMDSFLCHLLHKEWKKEYQVTGLNPMSHLKSKMDFVRALEHFLQRKRESLIPEKSITDASLGVLLSKASITQTLKENPELSMYRLGKLLDERLKARIKFLTHHTDKEEYVKAIREKNKLFQAYFSKDVKGLTSLSVYVEFLIQYAKKRQLDESAFLETVLDHKFHIYDLAALTLIRKRITEREEDQEFGQIFIDEAQDFGVSIYYAIRKALPKCFFTIMGDVSQNIFYDTGLNDWEELMTEVFTGSRDHFLTLSKSYRNTIEISEFAGSILKHASMGRYKIEPVIRHGLEVMKYEIQDQEQKIQKLSSLVAEIQDRNYDSIAIICKDENTTNRVQEELEALPEKPTVISNGLKEGFSKGVMVLPVHMTKGLEFDAVILYEPDMKEETMTAAKAKLLYVAVTRALHELHIIEV